MADITKDLPTYHLDFSFGLGGHYWQRSFMGLQICPSRWCRCYLKILDFDTNSRL